MKNSLTLKWGTLKGWHLETEEAQALLKEYHELGASLGTATQHDTPRQKEIILSLIDLCEDGDICLDWTGEYVSRDDAKKYIMEYGKEKQ